MKKHLLLYEILIFSLVFFIFILPPFFSAPGSAFSEPAFSSWGFPLQPLLFFVFSLVFYIIGRKKSPASALPDSFGKIMVWLIFPSVFTLCLLFCSALFFRGLSAFFTEGAASLPVRLPSGALQTVFCIMNFAFSAFYEEVVYRFYLPDALFYIIGGRLNGPVPRILCEVSAALLFALAHLYMGWLSVLNAALAHVILRICYKRTGSVLPGFAAHFCYNILALMLL